MLNETILVRFGLTENVAPMYLSGTQGSKFRSVFKSSQDKIRSENLRFCDRGAIQRIWMDWGAGISIIT